MSKLLQVKWSTVLVSLCLVATSLLAQAQTQQPPAAQPQVQQPQAQPQVQQPQVQQPQAQPQVQQPQTQQPPMQQPQTQYPPAQQYPPAPQQYAPAPQQFAPGPQPSFNDYLRGKTDGELAAKGQPAWAIAGFCCGIFGVGFAALLPPSPPTNALMGQSGEYIRGYTDGYKSKGRWKNVGMATIGCLVGCAVSLIINLATASSN
jgi:hypothetical protein